MLEISGVDEEEIMGEEEIIWCEWDVGCDRIVRHCITWTD